MKIATLLEETRLLAVVYGGRFQPFHKGHYAVYQELCKQFGKGAVWIATSNKTNFNPANGDISPFTFDERMEIMTQMFGISPDKVVKCKNPAFAPHEVLELYKAPVVCVMIAGDKDVDRYSKSESYNPYPLKGGKPVSFSSAGSTLQTATGDPAMFYYHVSHARNGSQSGTTIRQAFIDAGDDKAKQVSAFKQFYGKQVDDDVLDLIVSKIKMIQEPEEKKPKKAKAKAEPKPKDVEPEEHKAELKEAQYALRSTVLKIQQKLIDKDIDAKLILKGKGDLPGRPDQTGFRIETAEGSITFVETHVTTKAATNEVLMVSISPGQVKYFPLATQQDIIVKWVIENLTSWRSV